MDPLVAFRAEAERLGVAMLGLALREFEAPTRCRPWSVGDLLAHVRTVTGRLVQVIADPAPERADSDAIGYYRPAIFTPGTDTTRIRAATAEHAAEGGPALARAFDQIWRTVATLVAAQDPTRLIRTRHGDAMYLEQFLVTRVVEVGVHGLDLAEALNRPPWLTGPAARVIAGLLSAGWPADLAVSLGWDRDALITKAAGRAALTDLERQALNRHGVRLLSLS